MKKICILIVLLANIFSVSAYAYTEVNVEFNSRELKFDQPAIISENRTLVPVGKIFEALGAENSWDDATRTVYSQKNDKKVVIAIGDKFFYVNDERKELDVPAKIINNRTLLPLRAVSDAYDCVAEWDASTKTAKIYESDFYNAPKKDFNGFFKYFADAEIGEVDGKISLKKGNCILTFESEESRTVSVDNGYLEDLQKGLDGFKYMTVDYVKKITEKNIAEIKCRNRGNTIYYVYAYKDNTAYNLAVTIPDGENEENYEKIMYSLSDFKSKF